MNLTRINKTVRILNWTAGIAILISLLMNFFYAPTERLMGNVYRIFYFHVGSAWVGAVALFVALVYGIVYLRKPARKWDIISEASVEVGLLFLTIATAAGSVWGKPAWNTWWEWTPRLTLVTIAWLTYAAYFMLRGAVEDEEKRGKFSAVYVIIAFTTIIFAYISIRIFRDIHPTVFGQTLETAQGSSDGIMEVKKGLDSMKMGITLLVNTISFSILYLAWLFNRIRLQLMVDRVDRLKMRVVAHLQGEGLLGEGT